MFHDPLVRQCQGATDRGKAASADARVAFVVAVDADQAEAMHCLLAQIPSSRIVPVLDGANGDRPAIDPRLTGRQREILSLLLDNLSNKEIARRLMLSHYTVRNHVSRLLDIFGVPNRGAMIARCRTADIVEPSRPHR